jgi:hypothetical protein
MAIQLLPTETSIFRIVQAVRELVMGRHNAGGSVTLRINQTTTTVSHPNCSADSYVDVFGGAKTANAAAAVSTSYISSVFQGGFTITHASNAQTDRVFLYKVTGG